MVTQNEAAYPVIKYNCKVNVQPNLDIWNNQIFPQNGTYSVSDYIDSDKEGLSKNSTFRINVSAPQPDLETWTSAKRFTSNEIIRISDKMADTNKPGISKESQFTIDVPQLLVTPLTNQQITNTGHFEFLPPNGYDGLTQVSGTVDLSSKLLNSYTWEPYVIPATFDISTYNQMQGTNYIGFKSITVEDTNITPTSTKPIISSLIFTNSSNYTSTYSLTDIYNSSIDIPDNEDTTITLTNTTGYAFLLFYYINNGVFFLKPYLKRNSLKTLVCKRINQGSNYISGNLKFWKHEGVDYYNNIFSFGVNLNDNLFSINIGSQYVVSNISNQSVNLYFPKINSNNIFIESDKFDIIINS